MSVTFPRNDYAKQATLTELAADTDATRIATQAAAAALAASAAGTSPLSVRSRDADLEPLGYAQVLVTDSDAVELPSIPVGAERAEVISESGPIRFRKDAVDPTTADGMPLDAGRAYYFAGSLADVRLIAVSTPTVVHVSYARVAS